MVQIGLSRADRIACGFPALLVSSQLLHNQKLGLVVKNILFQCDCKCWLMVNNCVSMEPCFRRTALARRKTESHFAFSVFSLAPQRSLIVVHQSSPRGKYMEQCFFQFDIAYVKAVTENDWRLKLF